LHHYDRLGLLKPRRSDSGYRLYAEPEQTLEEIVALRFIGVALKEVAALRRQSSASFAEVLRAQRTALEARRRTLTRAISAVGAAEAALASGSAIDAELFRQMIEVMHMDTNSDDAVARYMAMLKAKTSHLLAMTAEERADLQRQFASLTDDVRSARDADPAGPLAQGLLERWASLMERLTGTAAGRFLANGDENAEFRATPELRDELWARRAEWLPAGHREQAETPVDLEQMRAQVQARAEAFGGGGFFAFMKRARDART
jgi:DNA-binding transcriptional MerR regulator